MNIPFVIKTILPMGTLGVDVILGALLLLFLVSFISPSIQRLWHSVAKFLSKYALVIAFFVSLTAMLGSLFYSEILHYTPCTLCWYQRIFMYPLSFLFIYGLVRKDRSILVYGRLLSIMGFVIAAYHYGTQWQVATSLVCSLGTSCTTKFMFHYGYITIPVMAMSAFAVVILMSFLQVKHRGRK